MSRVPVRMASREKESDILKTIMDGLAVKGIWHMRCNSGGMFGSYKGKRWAVKFGRKGMADILALPKHGSNITVWPLWIEVKKPGEKQTEAQRLFACEVGSDGHRYMVAHSWEEVESAVKEYV